MPTANTSESLSDELDLLSRAVEGDTFHFVVVQWGHYSQLQRTKTHLRQRYPERPALTIRAEGQTYEALMAPMYAQGRGFVFIDDFEHLLNDPDLCIAFNQRRGKLARLPLSVVCFIPPGGRYVEMCQQRLPDWWSVLSFLAELPNEVVEDKVFGLRSQFQEVIQASTLGGAQQQERFEEIQRLQERISAVPIEPNNANFLDSLFTQVLQLCRTSGLYQLGLEAANEWLKIALELNYEWTDTATYSSILHSIGIFERHLGNYDRAVHLLKAALDSALEDFDLNYSIIAVRQSSLAFVYLDLHDYQQARDLLEASLSTFLNNHEPDHPETATYLANLAIAYNGLGDYQKARDLLEASLANDIKNFGPEHATVAVCQSNLADVYYNLGEYQKARDLQEAALANDLKNFGPEHPTIATHQSNLGAVYQKLGDYQKARDLQEAALANDLKNFGPEHPTVAVRYNNLAQVEMDEGNWLSAKEHLQQALAIGLRVWGNEHPNVQSLRLSLLIVEEHLQKN